MGAAERRPSCTGSNDGGIVQLRRQPRFPISSLIARGGPCLVRSWYSLAGSAELRRRRGGAGSTGIQRASCLQATRPSACQAAVATRRRRRCPTKITAHRAAVTAASGARVELPQTKSTATLFIFEHIASAQKFYKKLRQDLIIKLT